MAIVALSRVSHRDGYIPRTVAWRNVYPCVSDGTHSRIKNGSSSLYNDYRVSLLRVFLRENTILTKCAHLDAGEGDCWSSLAGGRIAKRARVGRTDEARFAGRRKHEGRERRWSGAYRTGPCTCERQERAEATRKERGRNRKGERNGPHPRPGGNRGAL